MKFPQFLVGWGRGKGQKPVRVVTRLVRCDQILLFFRVCALPVFPITNPEPRRMKFVVWRRSQRNAFHAPLLHLSLEGLWFGSDHSETSFVRLSFLCPWNRSQGSRLHVPLFPFVFGRMTRLIREPFVPSLDSKDALSMREIVIE